MSHVSHSTLLKEKIDAVKKERMTIITFAEKHSLSPHVRVALPAKNMTAEQRRQAQSERAAAIIEMVSTAEQYSNIVHLIKPYDIRKRSGWRH